MAKTIKTHQPCPECGSSDAVTIYEDGAFCFAHNKRLKDSTDLTQIAADTPEDVGPSYHNSKWTYQVISYRGHSVAALEKYGIKVRVAEDGTPFQVDYPYPTGATKHRNLIKKGFTTSNHGGHTLFGIDKFDASSKYCTITEGEEDAVSAFEMLGSKYPVFSIQSSSFAQKDVEACKEYLDAFERIYLDFDNDEKGRRATAQVASLFPFSKIYYVKKNKYKDANEYHTNGAAKEYVNLWFNARRFDPENIVSSFSVLRELMEKPKKKAIATFPFKGLQDATYGIRTGETYLFKALEGIGKTELLGAIEHHVVKTTDYNIGVIHLEEDIPRSVGRFVNYEIQQPVHIEGLSEYSNADVFDKYKELVRKDNRVNFYQKGRNDDSPDDFLNAIRFMVASAEAKAVFFDHISRLASSFKNEDERKMLDYVSTKLSELAEELDFALLMISHVNDDGLTRGSRNISKEAWTVINLKRDRENPDPTVRNRTDISIEKNRPTSITGPVDPIYFDPVTFCLSDNPPPVLPQV